MVQTHQRRWKANVYIAGLSRFLYVNFVSAPWYVLVRTLETAQCNASDMQATLRAYLDFESPLISLNSTGIGDAEISPLFGLATIHGHGHADNFETSDKIALLLVRGADFSQRDAGGNNCLHIVMHWNRDKLLYYGRTMVSETYDELRDILTLMITAGADIYAINEEGATVSEVAYAEGHYQIWAEVLETCGYDTDKVFQEYDADHGWTSAIDTPCNKPPAEWPSKLSFAAYLEQREEKRKASCRVTEIVDDETAEEDWVKEEKERQRRLKAFHAT
jgi:hypothetical protein